MVQQVGSFQRSPSLRQDITCLCYRWQSELVDCRAFNSAPVPVRKQHFGRGSIVIAPRRRVLYGPAGLHMAVHAAMTQAELPDLLPLDDAYEGKHAHSAYANWLIPGKVLVGRYPYVEPSRCLTRDMGEGQLRELLKSGVTTFVCLQAELPPQQQMRVGGVGGFLPYAADVTMLAASMAGPPSLEEISGLRNKTLDRFLPARRHSKAPGNGSDSISGAPAQSLQFLHSPIVDLGIPTLEQVTSLVADLNERMRRGECLYLHCWGGRGRAGTIGACLLASLYGIDAAEALERVQRAFDTRFDEGRASPETEEQRIFVRKFVASL